MAPTEHVPENTVKRLRWMAKVYGVVTAGDNNDDNDDNDKQQLQVFTELQSYNSSNDNKMTVETRLDSITWTYLTQLISALVKR